MHDAREPRREELDRCPPTAHRTARQVDELFTKLESGAENRPALLTELAEKLAAHATVEEKIFYPAVMAKDTSDKLHESVEEHLQIKRVLADLIEMRPGDENFNAKLKVLREDLSHHAHREEEGKLFPMLRSSMAPDELAAIGTRRWRCSRS